MALTEGDKAICAEVAREIIEKVLAEHITSCPHGRALVKSKMLLIGLCLGSGVGSGSLVFALAQLLGGG